MTFNIRKNTYRCFVCGEHGGTIDLAMRLLPYGGRLGGGSFRGACKWLAEGGPTLTLLREETEYESKKKEYSFEPERYERFFLRPWLSDEARRFLFDERHLDPRVISWCRVSSWRDKQGTEWLQTPYYDVDGKLIGVQNRRLKSPSPTLPEGEGGSHPEPSATELGNCISHPSPNIGGEGTGVRGSRSLSPRFKFPYGSRCSIYNLPVLKMLKPGEELWITEGASDCWAMLSSGHKAIAIPSATLLSPKDKETLSTLSAQLSIEFHMYPDRDEPGERLFLQLKEVLPDLVHHQLPQGCKDYSEYYVKMRS